MTKLEKRIVDSIMDHMILIAFCLVSVFGVLVRLPMRDFVSGDASIYLLPWYDDISRMGLGVAVGNYNFLYQFLIYLMTKLPIEPLYAYKLLSCLFDFLLSGVCALLVYSLTGKKQFSLFAYCAVLLSPVVALNSALWAQCDSIYVFFAVMGLFLLIKDLPFFAMCCFGISLACKLQAVFVFPALIMLYLITKRFSVFNFLMIPLTMIVVSLPMVFWGRSLMELLKVYLEQTMTYTQIAMNYPSLFSLIGGASYEVFRDYAILLTITALGLLLVYLSCQKIEMTEKNTVILLFLSAFTCVLLLPAMHERYGYAYEILAWILVFLVPKTLPLCIGLQLLSMQTYSYFLFGTEINLPALGYANIAIYFLYLFILLREMKQESR